MGERGCIRPLSLALENANAILHPCKGVLKTHGTGQRGTYREGRRGTKMLQLTRHWGSLGGGSSPAPSPPRVGSKWNNRAIKAALPLCSSRHRKGVLVGFLQHQLQGPGEHWRPLSYFGVTLHPVCTWLSVLPWNLRRRSQREPNKASSREVARVRAGGWGACLSGAPWPSLSPLA